MHKLKHLILLCLLLYVSNVLGSSNVIGELKHAVTHGNVLKVKALLDSQQDLIYIPGEGAVWQNNRLIDELLYIASGGKTPKLEIVELLINKGADPSSYAEHKGIKFTHLHNAFQGFYLYQSYIAGEYDNMVKSGYWSKETTDKAERAEIVRLLVEESAELDDIISSYYVSDIAFIKALLEGGANPNPYLDFQSEYDNYLGKVSWFTSNGKQVNTLPLEVKFPYHGRTLQELIEHQIIEKKFVLKQLMDKGF